MSDAPIIKSAKSSKIVRAQKIAPEEAIPLVVGDQDIKPPEGICSSISEVGQLYLSDPQAFLPLDSETLVGTVSVIRDSLTELDALIEEEQRELAKGQKQIGIWEGRIHRNNIAIDKNGSKIKQNSVDIACDLKNRDFWWKKAERVLEDYRKAKSAGGIGDWAWLVKKYGLKNPEGLAIDYKSPCASEICNAATGCLTMEYKMAGNRYNQTQKHKEAENALLENDNIQLQRVNEQLQRYIATLYADEIEFLHDGVLLFKELAVKLKALERQKMEATYVDLRSWAEPYLDEFLRKNPNIHQRVVNEFRRVASIPLPVQNS